MAYHFQTACPNCGIVDVMGHQSRLLIFSNGDYRLTYLCPSCKLQAISVLTESEYVRVFNRIGRVYTDPPPELGDKARENPLPLSLAEVEEIAMDINIYSTDRIIKDAESWA